MKQQNIISREMDILKATFTCLNSHKTLMQNMDYLQIYLPLADPGDEL